MLSLFHVFFVVLLVAVSASTSSLRVAAAQRTSIAGNTPANTLALNAQRMAAQIKEAVASNVDLLVFPEYDFNITPASRANNRSS